MLETFDLCRLCFVSPLPQDCAGFEPSQTPRNMSLGVGQVPLVCEPFTPPGVERRRQIQLQPFYPQRLATFREPPAQLFGCQPAGLPGLQERTPQLPPDLSETDGEDATEPRDSGEAFEGEAFDDLPTAYPCINIPDSDEEPSEQKHIVGTTPRLLERTVEARLQIPWVLMRDLTGSDATNCPPPPQDEFVDESDDALALKVPGKRNLTAVANGRGKKSKK